MSFVVSQVSDVMPLLDGLTSLSQINSPHLDVSAEAKLPHARFWVAAEPGAVEPVAYALVWLVGGEVEIMDVATAPHARRRGAAKHVLTALLDAYSVAQREAAFLEVRAGNVAALALYQGLGFERTRTRRAYYSNGEDAVEMRLDLAARTRSSSREVSV